ncbi:MAG: RecQ family ATP-dependent DNA helicase [Spirochaetaceae bacterium]|jgi:ATP-dependent DNA helicase RecQ|nr:RecQ family ATP-dependent DNA helicase [Spirochaetaceae bacterium]
MRHDKLSLLKTSFGYTGFRPGQEAVIDALLAGKDTFAVMPTGAGKSLCYQIPALLLDGLTVVISPLISLMKDQVDALEDSGIPAAFLNSSLSQDEYGSTVSRVTEGKIKILYIAPERLQRGLPPRLTASRNISLVVIDEAHCISQWGHDFRPSYLSITGFISQLPQRPVAAAFTATATGKVREDIVRILGLNDPFTLVTGFNRENLYFGVLRPRGKFQALLEILQEHQGGVPLTCGGVPLTCGGVPLTCGGLPLTRGGVPLNQGGVPLSQGKSGIIYCATRKTVEELSQALDSRGFSVTRYHAGLDDNERHRNQDDFIYDRKTVMVATNAFGMGINKSNVSFVIHYNMPKNIESYYQEAGRAGRDGEPADCILLYSPQDVHLNRYLITNSRDEEAERDGALIEHNLELLKEMTFYATGRDCLRSRLLSYFGESAPHYCGNCSNCNTEFAETDITIPARKILSCVYRVEQRRRRFGKTTIIEILRGSKSKKITGQGLETLSTYGIMADTDAHRLRIILDYLADEGYLGVTEDEYPVVYLAARSGEVLYEKKTVKMMLPPEPGPEARPSRRPLFAPGDAAARGGTAALSADARPAPETDALGSAPLDEALFAKLRDLRTQLARKIHVPPYIIFSDAALRDMCRKRPLSRDAFLAVSGVGEAKLEKYGAAFMEVIRAHGGQ